MTVKRPSVLITDSHWQRGIWLRVSCLTVILAIGSLVFSFASSRAADHRDAPTVDGIPEGDITDLFAFLDPKNSDNVVLIMNVNPFSVPAELPGYAFSNDLLYQFKIDNSGDALEDLVIQVTFTTNSAGQKIVNVFGPARPIIQGAKALRPQGPPNVSGLVGKVLTGNNGLTVFAGTRDDPFVTDVGQLFRILTATQDTFRDYPNAPLLGHLRGRPLLATPVGGNSGVDGFGGFNVSSIQVEVPASMIKGAGSEVNLWATVSRPIAQVAAQGATQNAPLFQQFERMGQQLIATIFVPSSMRDAFNFATPDQDVAMFSSLIPNALTSTDPSGNTPAGRATVLQTLKLDGSVVATPNGVGEIEGAPLLLGSNFQNSDPDLIRKAVLPDVIRLDLAAIPPNDIPPKGIGIIGPSGMLGLQNGRRPGDAVTDILLQLSRQLADVTFPKGSGLPGASSDGSVRKGSLDCSALPCPDRRVLAVLDGTDFIRPDADIVALSLGDSGNDLPLSTSFPFLAPEHPLPGEVGTVDFPPQYHNP